MFWQCTRQADEGKMQGNSLNVPCLLRVCGDYSALPAESSARYLKQAINKIDPFAVPLVSRRRMSAPTVTPRWTNQLAKRSARSAGTGSLNFGSTAQTKRGSRRRSTHGGDCGHPPMEQLTK